MSGSVVAQAGDNFHTVGFSSPNGTKQSTTRTINGYILTEHTPPHIPRAATDKLKTVNLSINTKNLDKSIEQVQADIEKKYQIDGKKKQHFSIKPTQAKTAVERQGVSGVVLDEKAEPVTGATVRVNGNYVTACTDIDGRFTIQATKGQFLTVSCVGYITQDVVVVDGNELTVILHQDELLEQKNKELSDLFLRFKPFDKNKTPSK